MLGGESALIPWSELVIIKSSKIFFESTISMFSGTAFNLICFTPLWNRWSHKCTSVTVGNLTLECFLGKVPEFFSNAISFMCLVSSRSWQISQYLWVIIMILTFMKIGNLYKLHRISAPGPKWSVMDIKFSNITSNEHEILKDNNLPILVVNSSSTVFKIITRIRSRFCMCSRVDGQLAVFNRLMSFRWWPKTFIVCHIRINFLLNI